MAASVSSPVRREDIRQKAKDKDENGFRAIPPSSVGIDCRNDGGGASSNEGGRVSVFPCSRPSDWADTRVRPYKTIIHPLLQGVFVFTPLLRGDRGVAVQGEKRARPVGRGKGRHPSKGCFKGLLKKTPEDGNCCDTIPEVQAESGCRLLS